MCKTYPQAPKIATTAVAKLRGLQPGHQKLSHRKRVLRPSGGSEGMLSAVIFKPHQSVVYVQQILIRPLKGPLQRLASARSGCRHRPVGPLGPLQVSLGTLREHLADELVASTRRVSATR
jgi:hypothetical protein